MRTSSSNGSNWLRPSVTVEEEADTVRLKHGFLSVNLPSKWVSGDSAFREFLHRKMALSNWPSNTPEAHALQRLLASTGMLSEPQRLDYSLREVRRLAESQVPIWHAAYYAHPLWDKLRSGGASKSCLLAWVMHNHHLSRSAGVTAARCAAISDRSDVRRLFHESSIEEYAHYVEYYAVDSALFGLSSDQIASYVPLRSSLAFDHHMLRIAEEDWLGHVLVGYYQESTAAYFDQCSVFYDQITALYDLGNLFEPWKAHIRLDLDYGHSGAFTNILESDERVSAQMVDRAFANARVVAQHLLNALDEVLAENVVGPEIRWRDPSLLLHHEKSGASHSEPFDEVDLAQLRRAMAQALCQALGKDFDSRYIYPLGQLVEVTSSWFHEPATAPTNARINGIIGFLYYASSSSTLLAHCLQRCIQMLRELGQPFELLESEKGQTALRQLLGLGPRNDEQSRLLVVQFEEMMKFKDSHSSVHLAVDLFDNQGHA
ncbi:MAG: hypothetical protein JNM62_13135 [Flavobacteriales bacterium]|nr:hypothetical protein [Flavobacteriales bacterium]